MTIHDPGVGEAVTAWVHGWTASRGTPEALPIDGGWQVDTATDDEPLRVVLSEPTPARVAAVVDRELAVGTVLKLPGDPDDWRALVPDGWEVLTDTAFMTRLVSGGGATTVPAGYVLRFQRDDDRQVIAEVLAADDTVAAGGRLGIADRWAVPDRIATDSRHRRRGLGTVVMRALEDAARRHGVTALVLGASPDGVELYGHLGWTRVAPMAAFRLAQPRPPGTWG